MQNLFKDDYVASIFADTLRILGVNSVAISRRVVKKHLYPNKKSTIEMLNVIANSMLLGRIRICREKVYGTPVGFYKNILLLYDVKKYIEAGAYVVDIHEGCTTEITNDIISLFLRMYPRNPIILIDAILWELHHEEEKKKAIKQLIILISTLRKRLTDLNIILISPPAELMDFIKKLGSTIEVDDGSIYDTIDPSKAVVLDPYAHEELNVYDIMKNQYFVIGFLIDNKFSRPYATYMLKLLRGINFKRKAIKLYNSTVGIPKEINKIIDIILDVRLNGLPLENAIIDNMSIDDKIRRIVYDIERQVLERKTIDEHYIRKLFALYNVNEAQLKKICKRIRRAAHYWVEHSK